MNIFALPGYKVRVTKESLSNASFFTRTDGLEVDKEYTVLETIPGRAFTRVVLEEMPDKTFNALLFVDVDEQTDEQDKNHPYYKIFHR